MQRPLVIGAAVAAGAILLLVLGWNALRSDDPASTTTTVVALSSTTLAPTTTTTTVPPTTTTTIAPSTTTTIPAPAFGFFVDGYGVVDFGATPSEVQTALEPLFGPPTQDSGWIVEPICPGEHIRFIQYGDAPFDFRALFTDADFFGTGDEQFFSFNYNGVLDVPVSPPDLTVGTSVAELQALYPEVQILDSPFIQNQKVYLVESGTDFEVLSGSLTGEAADDLVTSVQGGIGCGE